MTLNAARCFVENRQLAESTRTADLIQDKVGISSPPGSRVLVAHDVISGPAAPPCSGPVNGYEAVSEQGLAKEMTHRLLADCRIMGDRTPFLNQRDCAELFNSPR
jgi:hypothetical protein